MLQDIPKHFQRPPFTHGSSVQHGCDMTRGRRTDLNGYFFVSVTAPQKPRHGNLLVFGVRTLNVSPTTVSGLGARSPIEHAAGKAIRAICGIGGLRRALRAWAAVAPRGLPSQAWPSVSSVSPTSIVSGSLRTGVPSSRLLTRTISCTNQKKSLTVLPACSG
jgi:hypothetical protein